MPITCTIRTTVTARGNKQEQGILKIAMQLGAAAAALRQQPERQTHERAERGLNRAEVDGRTAQ
jgi:hypothetical protein